MPRGSICLAADGLLSLAASKCYYLIGFSFKLVGKKGFYGYRKDILHSYGWCLCHRTVGAILKKGYR